MGKPLGYLIKVMVLFPLKSYSVGSECPDFKQGKLQFLRLKLCEGLF